MEVHPYLQRQLTWSLDGTFLGFFQIIESKWGKRGPQEMSCFQIHKAPYFKNGMTFVLRSLLLSSKQQFRHHEDNVEHFPPQIT